MKGVEADGESGEQPSVDTGNVGPQLEDVAVPELAQYAPVAPDLVAVPAKDEVEG